METIENKQPKKIEQKQKHQKRMKNIRKTHNQKT